MARIARPIINHQHMGTVLRYTTDWYTDTDRRTDAIVAWCQTNQVAPKTILDLGALTCRQATTLAETFDATVTAIDDSPELLDTFTTPQRGTVNIVTRRIGPTEIKAAGPYDIAICLSVLHHLTHWRSYLKALLAAAPIVFIELPHPDEVLPDVAAHKHTQTMHTEMVALNATPICATPGWDARYLRTTYVIAWP